MKRISLLVSILTFIMKIIISSINPYGIMGNGKSARTQRHLCLQHQGGKSGGRLFHSVLLKICNIHENTEKLDLSPSLLYFVRFSIK